ncbi:peptidylprolyl isomerase [Nocardia uniformis]|uniref:Peptidylprolyl isomerase n=1 Tax=Nocardia uniformis TaxID=53432 RepID=A0A849C553_9NOCA|nr:peptidylprolyl isomerase [Nocardia uniformis]NNH71550.1 peptidylprolyl isomerase [Nocardia uniformis]
MPSNEQRRAAAKRKLERQLANRAQRARKRKQLTIAASALGVVVAVAAGVGIYYLTRGEDNSTTTASETPEASLASAPPSAKPKADLVNCTYRDTPEQPAARPVDKPRTEGIATSGDNATLSVSMETTQGNIGLTLNNAESPCTTNSFASLAGQKYFDGTSCHRLSTSGLKILQCGDPAGTGMGGPGYSFDNEYPTDQYAPGDPAAESVPVNYKRGVIAMANGGPNQDGTGTNGSQFFLVYGDSQLPPQYTIFGTIDETGLATLDKIAAAGDDGSFEPSPGGGAPNTPVTIDSVQID